MAPLKLYYATVSTPVRMQIYFDHKLWKLFNFIDLSKFFIHLVSSLFDGNSKYGNRCWGKAYLSYFLLKENVQKKVEKSSRKVKKIKLITFLLKPDYKSVETIYILHQYFLKLLFIVLANYFPLPLHHARDHFIP